MKSQAKTCRQRKRHDEKLATIFRIVLSESDEEQFKALREAVIMVMGTHDLPHEKIGERKGYGSRKGVLFVTFLNVPDTVRAYMHLKSVWPRNVTFGRKLWQEKKSEVMAMKINKAWFDLMELDSMEVFRVGRSRSAPIERR